VKIELKKEKLKAKVNITVTLAPNIDGILEIIGNKK
jgi:hypothetical protein